jgi:hypothetical protein
MPRGDLSLAYSGCPFRNHLYRFVVPGLPASASRQTAFRTRSAENSFPRFRFRIPGKIIASSPLLELPVRRSRRLVDLAPLRDFSIPLALHSVRFPFGRLTSAKRSVSFTPHRQWLLTLPADHRSRSVSFRVAHCSANLLEPTPSSRRSQVQSNKKRWGDSVRDKFKNHAAAGAGPEVSRRFRENRAGSNSAIVHRHLGPVHKIFAA